MNKPIRLLQRCLASAALAALPLAHSQDEGLVVRIPGVEAADDPRSAYFDALLTLALEKTRDRFGPFRIKKSDLKMLVHGRAAELLKRGEQINLLYFMTSIEHERELLPIRIPLLKGLLGHRIFLIRKEDQDRFAEISSLEALRRLTAGQGHRWPDVEILRANGIKVEIGRSYRGLFKMLDRERFDFFPRGVTEIWRETEMYPNPEITVEETLMLVYPTALYFFVHPENRELADRIETGLRLALEDGSFDRLFIQYNGPMLKKSRMGERRILYLDNPILPPETPLGDPQLWYQLHD